MTEALLVSVPGRGVVCPSDWVRVDREQELSTGKVGDGLVRCYHDGCGHLFDPDHGPSDVLCPCCV